MRNRVLMMLAIPICLMAFGTLQAATPDNDVRAKHKDSLATKTEHAPRRDRVQKLTPLKLPSNAQSSDSAIKTTPRTPAQDATSWTGFYAGGHAGAGWGKENSGSPQPFTPDR